MIPYINWFFSLCMHDSRLFLSTLLKRISLLWGFYFNQTTLRSLIRDLEVLQINIIHICRYYGNFIHVCININIQLPLPSIYKPWNAIHESSYLCKIKFLLILKSTRKSEIIYDFNQSKKSSDNMKRPLPLSPIVLSIQCLLFKICSELLL